MKDSKYNVGDWLFCEFKLQMVKEVEGGNVTTVSDGYCEHSGRYLNDRCFPVDMRIKLISESYSNSSDRILRDGNNALNYPDIHRWLVDKWCNVCRVKDDDALLKKAMEELKEWENALLRRCQELRREEIGGIRLFRQ